jgi:hypothetical protein
LHFFGLCDFSFVSVELSRSKEFFLELHGSLQILKILGTSLEVIGFFGEGGSESLFMVSRGSIAPN